jgi:hypothetical protein
MITKQINYQVIAIIYKMRTVVVIALLFFVPQATAQILKQGIENLKEKKEQITYKIEEDTSGNPSYLIYPTLAFTPETKWEFGFVNLFLFYAKRDITNRLSEINSFTFFTQQNQYGIWLDHAIYGNKDKWFFLGRERFQSFPLKYYGIGSDASGDNYQVADNNNIQIRERILRKLKGNFYAGLEFDFQRMYRVNFGNVQPDFIFPSGSSGSSNLALGAGLVYDNRRNVMNVRKGLFAEIAYLNYAKVLASDFTFQSFQCDARYFTKGFHKNQVFAAQILGSFNSGTVPFNQLALMGGEMMMRGYYLGRFRDKNMLTTQAEYRFLPFPFSKRLGGAIFASAGMIAPLVNSFDLNKTKFAGGAGLKYLIFKSKDIFVRFDVAFTKEGNGMYFYIGEAF